MSKLDKPVLKNGHGGKRERSGRPAYKPSDDERKRVEAMAGYGVPIDQISALIGHGISVDTLRVHFKNELIAGKAKANAQVGQTLFQKAVGGDTAAAIWWSKTQMRWAETQKHELTGENGKPLLSLASAMVAYAAERESDVG